LTRKALRTDLKPFIIEPEPEPARGTRHGAPPVSSHSAFSQELEPVFESYRCPFALRNSQGLGNPQQEA